jgi:hypothetical protein
MWTMKVGGDVELFVCCFCNRLTTCLQAPVVFYLWYIAMCGTWFVRFRLLSKDGHVGYLNVVVTLNNGIVETCVGEHIFLPEIWCELPELSQTNCVGDHIFLSESWERRKPWLEVVYWKNWVVMCKAHAPSVWHPRQSIVLCLAPNVLCLAVSTPWDHEGAL